MPRILPASRLTTRQAYQPRESNETEIKAPGARILADKSTAGSATSTRRGVCSSAAIALAHKPRDIHVHVENSCSCSRSDTMGRAGGPRSPGETSSPYPSSSSVHGVRSNVLHVIE
eukprot:scaffold377_cov563-Prasinococcus_capsulatus_cf.AAC.31